MPIPNVGDSFRHYRILAKTGEGGMGVVLRAKDVRLGREVALKFLIRIGSLDPAAAERLRVEARSLAALNNANIVTIYDIDEEDGAPFLAMEWVSGVSLDRSFQGRPSSEDEFLRIAVPIAEALAAAHSNNIVHRDIKPGNVLLTDEGGVKLVDFGLARFVGTHHQLTSTATVMGTPSYMSPEQAKGEEAGPSSDVFSFGALSYELLTGRPPFEGRNLPAVLHAIVHTPHEPLATQRPELSPAVTEIIERCLQKRQAARYADGSELAMEVHHAMRAGRGVGARGGSPSRNRAARPSGSPEIRYCKTEDGASIAYAMHGSGPVLVRVLGWFTHLQIEWEWPAMRFIWERLGETHTVVRYDGRGIGLSNPWPDEFTEETRQLDLDAVSEPSGLRR